MNSHTDQFGSDGPLVRIAVGLPAGQVAGLRAANRPIPPPVEVIALIDTGADVTVFDPAALAPLVAVGLVFSRMLFVNAPAIGPAVPTFEYLVSLDVPAGVARPLRVRSLAVVERPLGSLGYQALLGRDVLSHAGLFYDGAGGRFTLVY